VQLERQHGVSPASRLRIGQPCECFQLLNGSHTNRCGGRFRGVTFDEAYLDFFDEAWPLLWDVTASGDRFRAHLVRGRRVWPPEDAQTWHAGAAHVLGQIPGSLPVRASSRMRMVHSHLAPALLSHEAAWTRPKRQAHPAGRNLRREVNLFATRSNAAIRRRCEAVRSSGFYARPSRRGPCGGQGSSAPLEDAGASRCWARIPWRPSSRQARPYGQGHPCGPGGAIRVLRVLA
jgi:hypothetical protein